MKMVESENKIAIVIITYNVSSLLIHQIQCIRKFCKDDYDIIVYDNSDIPQVIDDVKYITTESKVGYVKITSASKNGSDSAVFALNLSYYQQKDKYNFFLYLDHDMFPIREFSVREIIKGRVMAGLGQGKDKIYFASQCIMWDNRTIEHHLIDFSVDHQLGLDTGGNLYKVIEKYGKDACVFFNEKYYENPYFRKSFYNFYSTINDDMFMHFINGSGWNPTEDNEERINSLINILLKRTNG